MDKNSVFLIYPPITKFERYSSEIGSAGGCQIPLGIYYLASYLRQHKFDVKVVDAEALNLTSEQIINQIAAFNPKYIGISSTTVAFHRAYTLAQEIKSAFKDNIIILGGPHITANPLEAMQTGSFDFGVIGEGEITLLELLNALNENKDVTQIDGIAYTDTHKNIILTHPRPFIENLDILPFPAYDMIEDISIYNPPPSNYKTLPVVNIITSRGCPNNCTFCDKNIFGNTYRKRTAQNIVNEIKYLKEKFKVNEIAFVDDTFLIDKKRVNELFDTLKNDNISFYWTCMSRINNVDFEFLEYIKAHGCWHISFGIESGNQDILKLIKKNISLPKAKQVISWCRKLGIKTKGFFIIGHPTETLETINQTIKTACELPLDDIVVTLNTPIPGSQQYKEAEIYGTLDKTDWKQYNYWRPVFIPKGLNQEILIKKHKEIYRKFYLRPRMLIRYFFSFFGKGGLKRFITVALASRFLFKKTHTKH